MRQLTLSFMDAPLHVEETICCPEVLIPSCRIDLREQLRNVGLDLWAALRGDWADPKVHTITTLITWPKKYTEQNRKDIIARGLHIAMYDLATKIKDKSGHGARTVCYVDDLTCTHTRDDKDDSLTFSIGIIYE